MTILWANLVDVDLAPFSAALHADLNRLLSALVGLTGHGGLVGGDLVAGNEEAVDGNDFSVLQADDVAHM